MDRNCREILRVVEGNDASLKQLCIGGSFNWQFRSRDRDDFTRLGAAIGNNTQITVLSVIPNALPSNVLDEEFYDGLKQNSSIHKLVLYEGNIAGGACQKILEVFQEKKNLTYLRIENANLQHGGVDLITTTFRCCANISFIAMENCNITGENFLSMVEAIRGHRKLKKLYLVDNNIGNVGCGALATLLEDPHCSLNYVSFSNNNIGNEGVIAIANSLASNTKLKELYLRNNQFDESVVEDVFSRVLCNTSSINDTYASNHTLEKLFLVDIPDEQRGPHLANLLKLNRETNKSHVATRKILKYHPNIDMGPLFEWDAEGEQTLKALPYIVDWFDRAEVAVADYDIGEKNYRVEERKLSAIHQFATAMPLFFVSLASNIKVDNKKRKRVT